jgi:hypothetical protein
MSRVITFSLKYPAYHPRKGEATWFPEKILAGLSIENYWNWFYDINIHVDMGLLQDFQKGFMYGEAQRPIKHHTIRAGNRWEGGDKFSPRVWSGKPYQTKQIIIAPDIEIKKVWDIELRVRGDFKEFILPAYTHRKVPLEEVAANDGLSLNDFLNWFPKAGRFQIICWADHINY